MEVKKPHAPKSNWDACPSAAVGLFQRLLPAVFRNKSAKGEMVLFFYKGISLRMFPF